MADEHDLHHLAPGVDREAAVAAFRRRRRRSRSLRRGAWAAAAMVVVVAGSVAVVSTVYDDDAPVAHGPIGRGRQRRADHLRGARRHRGAATRWARCGSAVDEGRVRQPLEVRQHRRAQAAGRLRHAGGGQHHDPRQRVPARAHPASREPATSSRPVFVEPPGGCDDPLIPKTFVVVLDRTTLEPVFTLRLPADTLYGFDGAAPRGRARSAARRAGRHLRGDRALREQRRPTPGSIRLRRRRSRPEALFEAADLVLARHAHGCLRGAGRGRRGRAPTRGRTSATRSRSSAVQGAGRRRRLADQTRDLGRDHRRAWTTGPFRQVAARRVCRSSCSPTPSSRRRATSPPSRASPPAAPAIRPSAASAARRMGGPSATRRPRRPPGGRRLDPQLVVVAQRHGVRGPQASLRRAHRSGATGCGVEVAPRSLGAWLTPCCRRCRWGSSGRRSIRSCSACTTTTRTRRATRWRGRRCRWRGGTSGRTSRASTAGGCTTGRTCRGSRTTRTAASRPSPTSARASSTTPTRSAPPPGSAGATCSGSPPGEGIVHSEMFPLLDAEQPNPLELFQIWLNLPAEDKLVEPHFAMLWDGTSRASRADGVEVTVIAGELAGLTPPPPPPHSWASRPDADVAIWHLRFEPGARWTLPKAQGPDTVRTLYLFEGGGPRRRRHRGGRRHRSRGAVRRRHRPARAPRAPTCCSCRAGRSASRSPGTARS